MSAYSLGDLQMARPPFPKAAQDQHQKKSLGARQGLYSILHCFELHTIGKENKYFGWQPEWKKKKKIHGKLEESSESNNTTRNLIRINVHASSNQLTSIKRKREF